MGSLVGGWDSNIEDPKAAMYQRNRSLTNGEIEAYWKSKKTEEEQHLSSIPGSEQNPLEKVYVGSGERLLQRSNSLPITDRSRITLKGPAETGWWTRSKWAFLNEPPETATEGPSYKYASVYSETN